jgi:hypothetical protein
MGMSLNIYVGAMLYFPPKWESVEEVSYKTTKGFPTSNRFDPTTGEENTKVVESAMRKLQPKTYHDDMFDAGFEVEDEFYCPEYSNEDFFIPNYSNKYKGIDNFDDQGQGVVWLEDINPNEELIRFKKIYSKEIAFYKEKYPHMEVRFGVVSYYS